MMSDNSKIGVLLMSIGVFFLALGTLFLMDRKLLAMGNLLFLSGIGFFQGPKATLVFFGYGGPRWMERWKTCWRGLLGFQGGVILVLYGYSKLGMLLEIVGFLSLFGPMFPAVLLFLRMLPVVGHVLNMPGISYVADKIVGKPSSVFMI